MLLTGEVILSQLSNDPLIATNIHQIKIQIFHGMPECRLITSLFYMTQNLVFKVSFFHLILSVLAFTSISIGNILFIGPEASEWYGTRTLIPETSEILEK